MTPDPDKGQLLRQLRIDPAEREEAGGSRRRGWLIGAAAAAAIIAAAAFFAVRGRPIEVRAATAAAASAVSEPAAILQATGYVTAEREATVSAQIQGQLTHVYIQEGEHLPPRDWTIARSAPRWIRPMRSSRQPGRSWASTGCSSPSPGAISRAMRR